MDTAALDLSGLTENGDILELDDSRRLRLLIEPDDISPMDEINGDAYGKVAWVSRLHPRRAPPGRLRWLRLQAVDGGRRPVLVAALPRRQGRRRHPGGTPAHS